MPTADDLAFARGLARRAGELLLEGCGRSFEVQHKRGNPVDLVTEYDRRSEALILAEIQRHAPDDAVLGEEGGARPGRSGRRWLVDPLDGTTNFAHGHPVFAVSIALEAQGELEVGVVHAPALDLEFSAGRGLGARLVHGGLERPLAVSDTDRLAAALLATGFPSTTRTEPKNFRAFEALYRQSQGVRRMGAAALDLAFVAAGWFDAYWEGPLSPWDVAAGALVVREAGGTVTDLDGGPFCPDHGRALASNGRLHPELLAVLASIDRSP